MFRVDFSPLRSGEIDGGLPVNLDDYMKLFTSRKCTLNDATLVKQFCRLLSPWVRISK